MSIKNELKI